MEPFFLVLIEDWVYARLVLKPFRIAHFLAAEQLVQRADIDQVRRVVLRVAFDCLENLRRYIFGVIPVFLVPLLQNRNRPAVDLHVEFDILGESRISEVR